MTYRYRSVMSVLLMGWVCVATGADFKHENKPQNLKALFERVLQEAHVNNDPQAASKLFGSLIPDEARAKKGLKDNIAPDTLRQILDMHKKLRGGIKPEGATKIARATQKNVQVHAATTEEIISYRDGSVAYKEFPGGTKRVAALALRPGMTFYEVEYLDPGKNAGMKYHLIYWDGKQWSMMGPVWRALQPDK